MEIIFDEHVAGIERSFRALSVPEQMRVEQWVQKLRAMPSGPAAYDSAMIRNQYSGMLYNASRLGRLVEPFTSYPPIESLPPLRALMGLVGTQLPPSTPSGAHAAAAPQPNQLPEWLAAINSRSSLAPAERAAADVHAVRGSVWTLRPGGAGAGAGTPATAGAERAAYSVPATPFAPPQPAQPFASYAPPPPPQPQPQPPAAAAAAFAWPRPVTAEALGDGELHRHVLLLEAGMSAMRAEMAELRGRLARTEGALAAALSPTGALGRALAAPLAATSAASAASAELAKRIEALEGTAARHAAEGAERARANRSAAPAPVAPVLSPFSFAPAPAAQPHGAAGASAADELARSTWHEHRTNLYSYGYQAQPQPSGAQPDARAADPLVAGPPASALGRAGGGASAWGAAVDEFDARAERLLQRTALGAPLE